MTVTLQDRGDRFIVQRMGFMDKAKEMLGKHDDKVDQGLDKAGEQAKGRFAGQEENIDKGIGKAKEMTGEGDTTQGAAPEGGEPRPGEEQPPPQ